MHESDRARRQPAPEVEQFLNTQAARSIPPAALVDPSASADYLSLLRAPRPAAPGPVEAVHHVEDLRVGATDTLVRLYRPSDAATLPVIIFLHGGGWVTGNLDTHDGLSRRLANATGCIVLSVDYRLAPEHPYPAGLEDTIGVLEWAHRSVAAYGGDPAHIAIAGTSAGGNLAAAAALRARDEGGAPIALQVLLYPVTDSQMSGQSHIENARGYSLERDLMRWFWKQYVPDGPERSDPYVSPLHATDLAGLPPAIIVTTEFDPLRDEGEAYADRLRAANVPVTVDRVDGQIHGFLSFVGVWADADRAMAKLARDIRSHLPVGDSAGDAPGEG